MKHHSSTALLRTLLAGSALAAAALCGDLARPDAAVAMDVRSCTNAAWADYNDCLMESTSWWVRKGCDIAFELEYSICLSAAVGQIIDNLR